MCYLQSPVLYLESSYPNFQTPRFLIDEELYKVGKASGGRLAFFYYKPTTSLLTTWKKKETDVDIGSCRCMHSSRILFVLESITSKIFCQVVASFVSRQILLTWVGREDRVWTSCLDIDLCSRLLVFLASYFPNFGGTWVRSGLGSTERQVSQGK